MSEISEDIIASAANGDVNAFETIYKEHAAFITNVVGRIIENHEDTKDVVQEVFIKIFNVLGSFRHQSSLRTWMYRIAVNHALTVVKQRSKERNMHTQWDDNDAFDSPVYPAEEGLDEHKEKEKMVQALLNVLNPDQRACIVLRSIEGLSYQQISDTLNIPLNTVRTRIKRARLAMMAAKSKVVSNEL